MSDSSPQQGPAPGRRWRPRFGIKTIMLITALCAVLSAMLSGLLGRGASKPGSEPGWLVFFFMAVAAPMLVMIVLSVLPMVRRLIEYLKRRHE